MENRRLALNAEMLSRQTDVKWKVQEQCLAGDINLGVVGM